MLFLLSTYIFLLLPTFFPSTYTFVPLSVMHTYLDDSGCCSSGHSECTRGGVESSSHICPTTGKRIHTRCYPQMEDELNGVCYTCTDRGVCSNCGKKPGSDKVRARADNKRIVCNTRVRMNLCVTMNSKNLGEHFNCPGCRMPRATTSSSSSSSSSRPACTPPPAPRRAETVRTEKTEIPMTPPKRTRNAPKRLWVAKRTKQAAKKKQQACVFSRALTGRTQRGTSGWLGRSRALTGAHSESCACSTISLRAFLVSLHAFLVSYTRFFNCTTYSFIVTTQLAHTYFTSGTSH